MNVWDIELRRPRSGRARLRRGRALAAFAIAALMVTALGHKARAADPSFLTIGGGVYDFSDTQTTGVVSVEYSHRQGLLWKIKPMAGLLVTFDGAFYGYGGLGVDLFFGRRIVVTPSIAAGLYFEGGGKDLGHLVEFRSSVKLAYRFDSRARLGLDLYHLSNAGLDERNPGANALMVTYSMPLGGGS